MSAAERREVVISAAIAEFAQGGFAATSTESIARRVGVSQPYLFRLFPSKKALFLAATERCFDRIEAAFTAAVEGLAGEDALTAMGAAYAALLDDRQMLTLQLQMWAAACQDEDIRAASRDRFARLIALAGRVTGAEPLVLWRFLSAGMLMNVAVALDLPRIKEQFGELLQARPGTATTT
ncbi:MAG TPA: helix-turn-helix domain-containing protein [Mycobacteriales bacterium]|nr:helix-turn-helix domain-containing protein [Mycobacteriales bacterium]